MIIAYYPDSEYPEQVELLIDVEPDPEAVADYLYPTTERDAAFLLQNAKRMGADLNEEAKELLKRMAA